MLLLTNLGILAAIARISNIKNLSGKAYLTRKDYWFHIICLNLTVFLLYSMSRLGILESHYLAIRFFVSLAIVYTLGFCWKPLKKIIKNLFT